MAYSINQALLIGNVASEVTLKFTPGGQPVANFSLATNRSIKKNDQWEKVATFHRIVVWGKLAEALGSSLTKGRKVTVIGRIDNRSYEDSSGVKKYISEVVADSVIFEGKSSGSAPAPAQQPQQASEQEPADSMVDDIVDSRDVADDVPF